jgi:hypothetical protein
MNFKDFAKTIRANFDEISKGNLFTVEVDTDELFQFYLDSFPEGSNPLYKERTEHDCQCCKNFIRDVGKVVTIKNGKIISMWRVENLGFPYDVVADRLANYIEHLELNSIFKHYEKGAGTHQTNQLLDDGTVKNWNHFSCEIPSKHFSKNIGYEVGNYNQKIKVYERGLNEISLSAVDTVIDLIASKSIYRGEEFLTNINTFRKYKVEYDKYTEDKNIFIWETFLKNSSALIKNSVVGTLLIDISDGVDLEKAVSSYETKVAPENYKRTSSIITKRMVEAAMKTVDELGIREALPREFAKISDVSVNNVLFVDRAVKPKMKGAVEELLATEVSNNSKASIHSNIEDIEVDTFIKNVLPKVDNIKLLIENKHSPNFVSLIAPKDKEAKPILKWDNNFSWSYNGNVTDSIKERVKAAGGDVDGVIRVSLSWFNYDDLDIHVVEPSGNKIYFGSGTNHKTSGTLDVDMNVNPNTRKAVENITWPIKSKIELGNYRVMVNNYTKRETVDVGFEVEIECANEVYNFSYSKPVKDGSYVNVTDFNFNGEKIEIQNIGNGIEVSGKSKEVWGVQTEQFLEVDTVMFSPNHWDEQEEGNKHYIFTLKGCKNPNTTRGLYNEFLRNDLTKHRKVFDVLGGKLLCEPTEEQLSGVGFSSTKRNSAVCSVSGKINKQYNILF